MTARLALGLALLTTFLSFAGLVFLAQEWLVRSEADILVVATGNANRNDPDMRFYHLTSSGDVTYQLRGDSAARRALRELIEVGCRYRVRYLDQGRYVDGNSEGLFITSARKLDCPGAPDAPSLPQRAVDLRPR